LYAYSAPEQRQRYFKVTWKSVRNRTKREYFCFPLGNYVVLDRNGKKPLCSSDNMLTPFRNLHQDRDTLQTMHPLWLTVTFHSVRTSKNIIQVPSKKCILKMIY
jgi:hypothetical protein